MQATQFIWKNGNMIAWGDAQIHVLTHGLHYGSAVFEGIRVYKTDNGPAIFKLQEHVERFFYSATQLGIKIPYTKADISEVVIETVSKNSLEEGYIRPFAFYGYGNIKVVPTPDTPIDVIIACWPWGKYLVAKSINVATSNYIRIHPRSTIADAKISGHYVNSILAGLAIRNTHYHEALLLDAEGFVTECTAANIFIVKNGKIITTPQGTILMGITRKTVIAIAKEFGWEVEERRFKPEEIYSANEAFCCGTAVEVTAIRSLDDQIIAQGEIGPITQRIHMRYHQIVHGRAPEHQETLTWVNMSPEVF